MTEPIPLDGLPPDAPPVGRRHRGGGRGIASLDTSIANAVLPTIAVDLHATPAASIWVVNSYQLALVACLLPFASLGEIFGFRRVYGYGLALFTGASLVCALSWSLPTLTAARVLQGVGAAGIMSVNTALIRFIYPARQLGRGVGFNAMTVGGRDGAGADGRVRHPVGGARGSGCSRSTCRSGWLALLLAIRVPAGDTAASHRFDLISAMLNAGTFGLLILGIGEARAQRVRLPHGAGAGGCGGARAAAGAPPTRHGGADAAGGPVPPAAVRAVVGDQHVLVRGAGPVLRVAAVLLPDRARPHAVETGLLLTPWPVVTGLMAPVAGPLSDRYPPAILGGIGMVVLCAGLALMATLPAHPDTWRSSGA